jgi:hypothetical protein
MIGAELEPKAERPAYVRFVRRAVEDRQASQAEGKYVAKDVDYALITPPYSRDVVEVKAAQWFENLANDERAGRIPKEWVDRYRKVHEAWKNGQELPPSGTPIRGWGVTSPAQQEMLIKMNILTVEDLAGVNDEGAKRIGMGAMELKNRANAWLKQLADKGPLTLEVAALRTENEQFKATIAALTEKIDQLLAQRRDKSDAEPEAVASSAADLIDDAPPPVRPKLSLKK